MSITTMGLLLILIGFCLFILRPKWLLYLTIIFCGFSGSAVVLVGGLAVQPSYYFAILWMLKRLLNVHSLKKSLIKNNIWLTLFMLVSTVSISMAALWAGSVLIMNVEGKITLLGFSSSNLTQLIYLWFCFIFYMFLYSYLRRNKQEQQKISEFFLAGVAFVCVITLYQIVAFIFNLPFDELFRQNLNGNWQGSRIYGPCIEASMLCYYLVAALPICVRSTKTIYKRVLLLIILFLGVYSFSSSFILGVLVWGCLELFLSIKKTRKIYKMKDVFFFLFFLLVVIFAGLMFREYIFRAIEKLIDTLAAENISGMERSTYFALQINAFLKYPILGVGFGSCRGTDLLSTWLACVGVVGIVPICAHLFKIIKHNRCDNGVNFANIIVWLVMFAGVPEPYNLFVWLFMALSAVQSSEELKRIDEKIDYNHGDI